MLKQNFRRDLRAAENDPEWPKVLVKFGDRHLYKGLNPLEQRDLGNYIAEIADGQGITSLHICVLGAKGRHRLYAGYERWTKLETFVLAKQQDYRWLKPFIDNQLPDAWMLFDLRKLRFQRFVQLEPGAERLFDGYDLLVIVLEFTPADLID